MDGKEGGERSSPFQTMFETFRGELDEHHDRRERVIKASRDITAASKKIIFALQRVRQLNKPLAPGIVKTIQPHANIIAETFKNVSPDLQGVNYYRYARNISGGIQEYVEAISFQHYLEAQRLLTLEATAEKLQSFVADGRSLSCTPSDYVLGLFDMTGELMRFAVTTMATQGALPGTIISTSGIDIGTDGNKRRRSVLQDLQELRARLETLDNDIREYGKKLSVTQASVQKVEKVLYGLVVRGSERPKGWMPDLSEAREVDAGVY